MSTFSTENEHGKADRSLIKIALPFLIVAMGVAVAFLIIKTKPGAVKKRPERRPPIVATITAEAGVRRVVLSAMGTVVPSRSIDIRSMVSGEVIHISPEFIPGGILSKGDVVLKIDPADYRLDVKRKESLMNHARAVYELEMGHQEVAREELKLMQATTGKTIEDDALALRKPQLDQAKAQVDTAIVDLAISKLNLARTVIRAPFNALVISKNADQGLKASAQSPLGEIVGTDSYWVEAAIPVSQLPWIIFPGKGGKEGSDVTIETRDKSRYSGKVIRLTANLNEQSRLAKVLVQIDDPLGLKETSDTPPMLLGSYVSITIGGRELDNVIVLPRSVVRDGDTVWVLKDSVLSIRSPGIIWRGKDRIFIDSGIESGELIITSNLSGPVEGMTLLAEKDN